MSAIIGTFYWSASLDFVQDGEIAKVAGIHITDTIRLNMFFQNYCKLEVGEKIITNNEKKVIPIYKLVVGNFFNYIFPNQILNKESLFIFYYDNHIWLASSPQILRFAYSSYSNNVTMTDLQGFTRSSYVFYTNLKKYRAAIISNSNSISSQFLISFLQTHRQLNECVLEMDYSTYPYFGTFRIW